MSGAEQPEFHADELLAALLGREVRFLVVGGIAARLHGATRTTNDLDVCVPWARENFDRLAAALEALDARLDLPAELGEFEVRPSSELLGRTSMTRWRTRAGILDILREIPAGERGAPLDYGQLEQQAVRVRAAESTVLVAALDDIIASKQHAGRAKDHEALPELYALRNKAARKLP